MNRLLLDAPIERKGQFWSSTDPDHKVAGVLRYAPNETIRLALYESLQSPRDALSDSSPELTILGSLHGGRSVSLFRAFQTKGLFASMGGGDAEYVANLALIGCWCDSETTDIAFESVVLESAVFDAWCAHRAVFCPDLGAAAAELSSPIRLVGTRPERLLATLANGEAWSVESGYSVTGVGGLQGTLQVSLGLRLGVPSPLSLEAILDRASRGWEFVEVCAACPIHPRHVEVSFRDAGNGEVHQAAVIAAFRRCEDEPDLHPFGVPVPLSSIRGQFQVALRAWDELRDGVATVLQLARVAHLAGSGDGRVRLLLLTQALETFHRERRHSEYLSQEEHEACVAALTAAIPSGVPKDFRESIKSRLRFSNQVSLRRRLRELFGEIANHGGEHIVGSKGALADQMVDTRNHFTHWDEQSKGAVFEGLNLHRAGLKLLASVYLLLYRELGWELKAAAGRMKDHPFLRGAERIFPKSF